MATLKVSNIIRRAGESIPNVLADPELGLSCKRFFCLSLLDNCQQRCTFLTGKGAGDLVTLYPVDAAGAVGKGGASAGKNVAVGTARGRKSLRYM